MSRELCSDIITDAVGATFYCQEPGKVRLKVTGKNDKEEMQTEILLYCEKHAPLYLAMPGTERV